MKLIADALIPLPFTLDFCARGPEVEPLACRLGETDALLYFPPSLSEGTDGQGIFGEWAWWTGTTLRLMLERSVESADDPEALRRAALAEGNEILRRFLNACRRRLARPDVHPIRIDPRALSLDVIGDDGRRQSLAEPVSSFFYRNLPTEPPLQSSISSQTLETLQRDVQEGHEPSLDEQLRLDAELLEARGEPERAAWIRKRSSENTQ